MDLITARLIGKLLAPAGEAGSLPGQAARRERGKLVEGGDVGLRAVSALLPEGVARTMREAEEEARQIDAIVS